MSDVMKIADEDNQYQAENEFGSTIEKLRFLEESNSALIGIQNKLERLSHFHSEMVLSYDVHYILEKGLAKFQELVNTKVCSVFLVEDNGFEFVHRASIPGDLAPVVKEEVDIQISSGTFGWIINSGMPSCVPTEICKGKGGQALSMLMAPLSHKEQTIGVVVILFEEDQDFIRQQTLKLLYILAGFFSLALQNAYLFNNLKSSYFDTIKGVANSIEARDPYTKGHSRRVGQIARVIAEELNWKNERVEFIDWGGMLHDVGKIGIHDAILNKKGKLDTDEFEKIKLHPSIGAQIVEGISFLEPVVPYIYEHHERFNGKGYPRGLSREQISVEGRLLAVADVFDAMTTNRPYQKAFNPGIAFEKIVAEADTLFDPGIIEGFKKSWTAGTLLEIIPVPESPEGV